MTLEEYTKLVKESGFAIVPHPKNKKVGDPAKNANAIQPKKKWQETTVEEMDDAYIKITHTDDCNAFAVCGRQHKSNGYLFVIDVDVNGDTHSGISNTDVLNHLFGNEKVSTYTQTTPSGGTHYFFTAKQQLDKCSIYFKNGEYTKSSAGAIKTGVDILGAKAQVMLSPSKVIINGEEKKYENNGLSVSVCPDAIFERLLDITDTNRINKRKADSKTEKEEFYIVPQDKDEIVPYLKKAAEAGEFDDRQMWVNLAFAIQDDGRDEKLFYDLSWPEDDVQWNNNKETICHTVFDSACQNGDVTKKSLYYWAKKYGWTGTKKIDPNENRDENKPLYITNYYYSKTLKQGTQGGQKEEEEFDYKRTFFDDGYFIEPTKYFKTFVSTNGKTYLTENTSPEKFITTTHEFFNLCAKYLLHIDFKNSGPLTETKYLDFVKSKCPKYSRLTTLQEIGQDEETLLVLNKNWTPKKNGSFRKFLDIYTDSSLKDSYRRAAGILSGFLPRKYDAKKPLMGVTSSDPGGGKTQSVQIIQDIIEGCESRGICIGVEENLAEQISGSFGYATKNVIIDDIQPQHMRSDGVFKILTQALTSQTISAWIMGESHAKILNNKTFWATFSYKVKFTEDVLLRLCRINMKSRYEITDDDRLRIEGIKEEILKNRGELMEDILYHVYNLYNENKNKYIPHSRFTIWSTAMNNMLAEVFPEVECFDFGLNADDEKLSEDRTNLKEFLEVLWPVRDYEKNGFIPNEVIYQIALKYFGDKSGICKNRQTVNTFMNGNKNTLTNEFDIQYTENPIKYKGKTQRGFFINSKVGANDHLIGLKDLGIYIERLKMGEKTLELIYHDFSKKTDQDLDIEIENNKPEYKGRIFEYAEKLKIDIN